MAELRTRIVLGAFVLVVVVLLVPRPRLAESGQGLGAGWPAPASAIGALSARASEDEGRFAEDEDDCPLSPRIVLHLLHRIPHRGVRSNDLT